MGDTYGALDIPVQVPTAGDEISDPAITLLVNYCQAILNVYAATAWATVAPPVQTGTKYLPSVPCKRAYGHNPEEVVFNESDLPALYAWRHAGTRPYWLAEDWRVVEDTWTVLWIMRPAIQGIRKVRQSIINAVVKLIDRAVEMQRDPNFVAPGDTDPTAATTLPAPAAIKTSIASDTSAAVYTGAALNGATGSTVFAPAQLPTVTVTGSGCTGDVVFTGLGADGEARIARVTLSGTGTFIGDWLLTQVTQIDVPAQADTAATLAFGLAGFVGLGSEVFTLGNFVTLEVASWTEKTWTLKMTDNAPPRSYDALEITFNVRERWVRDVDTAINGASSLATQYPVEGPLNLDLRETSIFT